MIIVRISKFVYTYKSKCFCLHNKTNEKIHICCSSGSLQSKTLDLGPQENALFQKEISASTASLQLKHRHWVEQCRRGAMCREKGQIRFLLLEPIIFMIFSTLLLSYQLLYLFTVYFAALRRFSTLIWISIFSTQTCNQQHLFWNQNKNHIKQVIHLFFQNQI